MTATVKNTMRQVMNDAWRMFRVTGENFSECLKRAWMLLKLKAKMQKGTAQFFYKKISGEVRQAFGTLEESVLKANVKGTERKQNDLLFTYWDNEKQAFRCFKKFNLISIA